MHVAGSATLVECPIPRLWEGSRRESPQPRTTMHEERAFYADLVNRPVRVYLMTGIKLEGTLKAEYERAIVLTDAAHGIGIDQLLYKHSITTVAGDVDAHSSRRIARTWIRGNPGQR